MTKVLYCSSWHPVLEWDDLVVLNELNIDWFSTGIYLDPSANHPLIMRGTFNRKVDPYLAEQWYNINPTTYGTRWGRFKITKEFADNFDIIFINNFIYYLEDNWEAIKHKPVIYRTYDRHTPVDEAKLARFQKEGLKVVRLFDFETRIPFATKSDAVISNYVDSCVYKDWKGDDQSVLTFNNDFADRLNHPNPNGGLAFPGYHVYLKVKDDFPTKFYGGNNRKHTEVSFSLGEASWDKQKEEYRNCRVYFSLGSKPAPYTYSFIEAFMTGIPTINFGPKLGDYDHPDYRGSYIVPSIVENGVTGFCSDSEEEIRAYIQLLLDDHGLANEISINSRNKAKELFDKPKIVKLWGEFLKGL